MPTNIYSLLFICIICIGGEQSPCKLIVLAPSKISEIYTKKHVLFAHGTPDNHGNFHGYGQGSLNIPYHARGMFRGGNALNHYGQVILRVSMLLRSVSWGEDLSIKHASGI